MTQECFISIKILWLNVEIHFEKLGEPRNLGCVLKKYANGSEVRNYIMSKGT